MGHPLQMAKRLRGSETGCFPIPFQRRTKEFVVIPGEGHFAAFIKSDESLKDLIAPSATACDTKTESG